MNARRILSILVLGALLLAQAPPARAGRMLCPMKRPARTEPCSRCDAPAAVTSKSILRATSCCRTAPAPATESTPLVLSARSASSGDPLPLTVPPAASLLASLDSNASLALPFLSRAPIPDRLARTTVLRN